MVDYEDYEYKIWNKKTQFFLATGTFFGYAFNNEATPYYKEVRIPNELETPLLCTISLTMHYPFGGDFDAADAIYADISMLGDAKPDDYNGVPPGTWDPGFVYPNKKPINSGGCWDGYFGAYGNDENMGICSWFGVPPLAQSVRQRRVIFRLFVAGDSYVGATYSITPFNPFKR
jgi:hypothetical protein